MATKTRCEIRAATCAKNDDLQGSKLLRRNKTVNRPTQYVGTGIGIGRESREGCASTVSE